MSRAHSFITQLQHDLENNGLPTNHAKYIIARYIEGEKESAMASRWSDCPDDYPEMIYTLQWRILCTYALKYIDEFMPKAWFRPVFLSPSDQEIWLKSQGAKND